MDQMTEWKNNDFFKKTVHVSFIVGTLQLTGMEPEIFVKGGRNGRGPMCEDKTWT